VIASLEEDELGVVQVHVGKILQSFYATLETLEKYVANPPLHWTDTEAKSGHIRLQEPELLILKLRSTIGDITQGFSRFLDEMELPGDVRSKLPTI
jgi:nucleoporin NDC1